jgi:hypothetical protein
LTFDRLRPISPTLVMSLLAVWTLTTSAGCRSKTSEKLPPVSDAHLEAMVTFIKHEACKPSSCDGFACETFSEGQTKGLPSHLVRCRWMDSRIADSATPKRCAYVHYSVDSAGQGFRNLFLSSPAFSDTCEPDKEFSSRVKSSQGYSGRMP